MLIDCVSLGAEEKIFGLSSGFFGDSFWKLQRKARRKTEKMGLNKCWEMLVCALLVPPFSSASSDSEEDLLFAEYSDWRMRSMPEYASGVGVHRYDDRLSDPSPEGARWVRQDSNSFKSFVGMSIKASLTSSLCCPNFPVYCRNKIQLGLLHFTMFSCRKTAADCDDFKNRADALLSRKVADEEDLHYLKTVRREAAACSEGIGKYHAYAFAPINHRDGIQAMYKTNELSN